jgi:hypothetical protein
MNPNVRRDHQLNIVDVIGIFQNCAQNLLVPHYQQLERLGVEILSVRLAIGRFAALVPVTSGLEKHPLK